MSPGFIATQNSLKRRTILDEYIIYYKIGGRYDEAELLGVQKMRPGTGRCQSKRTGGLSGCDRTTIGWSSWRPMLRESLLGCLRNLLQR